jgi:hypothetical protein
MKRTLLAFVPVTLVMFALIVRAQTNTPLADAHVRDGSFSNTNYGATSPMEVQKNATAGNSREAFLKFSLAGLGIVKTATLRINADLAATGPSTLTLAAVSDTNWVEGSITWSNRPVMGTNFATKSISALNPTWYSIDVTDYIRSEQSAARSITTIGLRKTATGTPLINIRSQESTNSPQLEIVTNSPTSIIAAPGPFINPAPATVILTACVTDADEDVIRVDYYTNNLFIGFSTHAPFYGTTGWLVLWTNAPVGDHTITAVAIDDSGLSFTSAPAFVTVELPNVVGSWSFTYSNDLTASDFTPIGNYHQYYATLSGSVNWVSGYSGYGIELTGSTIPLASIPNTDFAMLPSTGKPFTIKLWIKPYPIPLGWSGLVMSESSTNRGWDLALFKEVGGQVSINFWSSDNSGTLELSAPITLTTNQWHKLDVTFDGGIANIYLDGKNVGTGYGGIQMSTNAIYIGGVPGMTNFNGVFDELRIYNRELPAHEIGPLANVQLVTVFSNSLATNVVLNGTVPPGRTATYQITAQPTNGTLAVVSGATWSYTPTSGYKGADAFQYTVSDGTFTSTPATVLLSVVTPRWLSTNENGNGLSPSSPMLAFPASALDEIIRTNNRYACFFYENGVYEMSGDFYGLRATANWGCKHIGNGTNTILRWINAWAANDEEVMFGPGSCERVDDFEISNLVLDCNGNNQPKITRGEPITITVSFPTAAVSSVVLNWNYDWVTGAPYTGGHAREYGIYVRVPGTTNYALVATNYAGVGGINGLETNSFAATNTDQVRVILSKRGMLGPTNLDFYTIGEMTVYAGVQNVSLGQSVSAVNPNGGDASLSIYGFLASYLVDGTANRWVGGYRGMIGAVGLRPGSNLKFTNLKIIGFATTPFRECFPFGIGSPCIGAPAFDYGNILVENCTASDPATNNHFNVTVFSVSAAPPYHLSNAVVRNCRVMDLRSQFYLPVNAYSSVHVENSYATNCHNAVYFEPAPPGLGGQEYPLLYFRSNLFENVNSGVVLAFWASPTNGPQIAMGTVVLLRNEIILATNVGYFGFIASDAGSFTNYGITTNVVLNGNSIHFPSWANVPALTNYSGGIYEWNFLNHVAVNNLIHLNTGLDIELVFADVLSNGSKRALANNTNLSGTLLQVKAYNTNTGTAVPAISQQWSP